MAVGAFAGRILPSFIPLAALCSLAIASIAAAESKHIFGIHTWDWGSNVDVMSHRTGWIVEANSTSDGSLPNIGGRYKPATAEGYTVIQRLDWSWDQTIPLTEAQQSLFAQQCAQNWAANVKNYCRYYCIGNEVEYFGVTPAIYASCFQKVRNAIKAEQPDAVVIIGHMNNVQNQRQAIQILGPNGYDGLTAHTGSSLPDEHLDVLDQENARPGVGVYITEFGWVRDTNPNSMTVMRSFYQAIGQSNATRTRQVYCACWYLYPSWIHQQFSLELAQIDNPAFEAATALGSSFNAHAQNPILMSNLIADIPDTGTSVVVSWSTNLPARRQMWWTPVGTSGAGYEAISDLQTSLTTSHSFTITGLNPSGGYEVMPCSTANNYGDAGGRRFRVQTGPWNSTATQNGAGRVTISWSTNWPMAAHVDYGPTSALGQTASRTSLCTQHAVTLEYLPTGNYYYRIRCSEPNPDGTAALHMRSPQRTFTVVWTIPGDLDQDEDVDQDDFGRLQRCLSGSGNIELESPLCAPADLDGDLDVDGDDVSRFRGCMNGPSNPPSLNCLQ